MSSSFGEQLESMMKKYQEKREDAEENRRRLREIECTATDQRQTVKVTVGVHGELKSIEFPTGAYRRMAPKELADVLLSAIAEAKERALAKVDETMASPLLGVSASAMLRGDFDMNQVLPEMPEIPDAVRGIFNWGE